jgi:repressor LexA
MPDTVRTEHLFANRTRAGDDQMENLSGRQAEILAFITDHCDRTGYPPTVREIGNAVGLASPSTVHAHLAKLTEGGYLQRDASKPRAMNVSRGRTTPSTSRSGEGLLPLVGAVAAGLPRLADEQVEDWVQTPFAADFALRVTGQSMRDAGILDGDVVAVRRQDHAENGQIIVAMIGEEATVKRFQRADDHVLLIAENPDFAPIEVREDFRVAGRVVGVLRTL